MCCSTSHCWTSPGVSWHAHMDACAWYRGACEILIASVRFLHCAHPAAYCFSAVVLGCASAYTCHGVVVLHCSAEAACAGRQRRVCGLPEQHPDATAVRCVCTAMQFRLYSTLLRCLGMTMRACSLHMLVGFCAQGCTVGAVSQRPVACAVTSAFATCSHATLRDLLARDFS